MYVYYTALFKIMISYPSVTCFVLSSIICIACPDYASVPVNTTILYALRSIESPWMMGYGFLFHGKDDQGDYGPIC